MPEEWAHQGMTGARVLRQQTVEIRKKLIAEIEVAPADRLDFRPERPGFLTARADIRAIAQKRREDGHLQPTHKEVRNSSPGIRPRPRRKIPRRSGPG